MLSECASFDRTDEPDGYEEIPAVIRTELNADTDRETIARMRDLARKKRMLRPDITDHQMADYLALAENFQNAAKWISARRLTTHSPVPGAIAWLTAAAIVFGLLTTMLIVAIATSV